EDTGHTDTRIQDTQARGYRTHGHEDTGAKTVNKPYICDVIANNG
ncbi:hypothetical protein H6A66_14530, partial [Bacteroides caecigallinarum]|nr:hypothetical protein [Bacteroides caecigallinarum]